MFKICTILAVNVALGCALGWYAYNWYGDQQVQPTYSSVAPPSVPRKLTIAERLDNATKSINEATMAAVREAKEAKSKADKAEEKVTAAMKSIADAPALLDRVKSLEAYKAQEELKSDKYQCKTDPVVLKRLDKLEKWQKNFDKADEEANKKLDENLKNLKELEEKIKEGKKSAEEKRVDWIYNITDARLTAAALKRPIFLAFSQSIAIDPSTGRRICEKCYSVRENCYKDSKCYAEISKKFVPYWAPTGWSDLTAQYDVIGFPQVVVDYGRDRKSFVPSDDPVRFLQQLKEYE